MSDDEEQYNPKAHKTLLQGISNLGKVQHIRKTTRNEPIRQQDEFQLVKPADETTTRHPVGLHDIVKVLKGTKRHIDAGKKLKVVQSSKKVLDKPLEKPQVDRLKRGLGYEKTKKNLERWDAVVTQNRHAETQVFPLPTETIYVDTSLRRKPLKRALKSELALELEAEQARLKAAKRALAGETENDEELAKREEELLKKKLTRDELIQRRRELTYLKIREAQRSLKARKQNKIKSKKYHRLLKKQKMQEEIKNFEALQKTDPEAAMKKLNELEMNRVLERANLRHKNTGSWAKNLQIRAKYDRDVRKDLAEQLQISRQLTQKKYDSDDESGDDNEAEIENKGNNFNPLDPWARLDEGEKLKGENWRKYWVERNENAKLLSEYKKSLPDEGSQNSDDEEEQTAEGTAIAESNKNDDVPTIAKESGSKNSFKRQKIKANVEQKKSKKAKIKAVKVKVENEQSMVGEWLVEEINPNVVSDRPKDSSSNIDDIFDKQEDKIQQRMSKKLEALNKKAKLLQKRQLKNKKENTRNNKDALKNLKDLSFKNETKRPVIDEELNGERLGESNTDNDVNKIAKITETVEHDSAAKFTQTATTATTVPTENIDTVNVDLNKVTDENRESNFIGYDAILFGNDSDEDDDEHEKVHLDQEMNFNQEAFEDEDIPADFARDKAKASEIKNDEVDLFMPGWGSWAGSGISSEKQQAKRNQRLVLKLAEKEERRDDNKGGLYINETPSKHLRSHLVSDVPFPFTSVAEYEGSIRATIGRNCVPETAFRMLTRPAVITHKGKIIEPMDQSELSKPQRKLRHVVDKRISRMKQEKVAKILKAK